MNENKTFILTPVKNENDNEYVIPTLDELSPAEKKQLLIWGLESMSREVLNSGWSDENRMNRHLFRTMLHTYARELEDTLTPTSLSVIVNSVFLEVVSELY